MSMQVMTGGWILECGEVSFQASNLVVPRAVVFNAADGLEIHGQLIVPAGAKDGDTRPAVIFMHGDDDRNVMFIQTTDLVQRLREREVHIETLVFPDDFHGFYRYDSWLRTFEAAVDFFDRFLVTHEFEPQRHRAIAWEMNHKEHEGNKGCHKASRC